jgi:prepilin-type N-terminal cleavage/methylation domain-containing protein
MTAGNATPGARDKGFTLVEVLVTMGLFGLLSTILMSFALGTSRVTEDTRELSGVNEESRLAMERLTRELRQADEVLSLKVPVDANDSTAVTFWTDFDGDDTKDRSVTDPEVLTYRWDPTSEHFTLTADDESGTAVTRQVLAANVSDFDLDLYSSMWEYDEDGDGVTHWTEIDAAGPPIGDDDGRPDALELDLVDLVKVRMTVLDGTHRQTYRTQVDLRNRNQN